MSNALIKNDLLREGSLVCFYLDRNEYMLVSLFSVLKGGGAYVPMDIGYPDERLQFILEDTQAEIVLTNKKYLKKLEKLFPSHRPKILAVDDKEWLKNLEGQSSDPPPNKVNCRNLAYIIYTSGTTGNPKGVMLEHQGIVNRIQWMNNQYPITPQDKILQKTPYVFDVSVWELFWASWYGACLVFARPEGHRDAEYILELMKQESITIAHFVPSMLSVFEDTLEMSSTSAEMHGKSHIPSLRYLFCSGEELKLSQVKKCHSLLPTTEIHNLYGPTEASVDVLFFDCTDRNLQLIPIGKPIDNTKVYILDKQGQPLPIGALGELYLGGIGLARGYLNRLELTNEKFILNPFQTKAEINLKQNARLYKTGDLVRYLPDGNIEFIGRNDFQVKIRGHRIELGEIEEVLIQFPGVKQGLVLVKSHGTSQNANHQYLVGYYVAESKLDEVELLKALESRLPEYMVPSALVHLEKLPITVNGKLDRKALPEPGFQASNEHQSPRNEVEKQCCKLWAEVLGLPVEAVGIRDDFFRLGGDSIISIQLVSRLRQRLGLSLSVKDIFNYKTIEKLYDHVLSKVQSGRQARIIQSEQGRLSGEFGLLPIQEWFFEQGFAKASHWNQSFLIKTPALERDKLAQSVLTLQEYHDAFRLRYRRDENGYLQNYASEAKKSPLKVLNLKALNLKEQEGSPVWKDKIEEILTEWQSGFDIEKGEVCSFGLIEGFEDGSSRIHIAAHHLIIDTISWRILLEDLRELYQGKHLDSKGSSYRQWVQALRRYSDEHPREVDYWQGWESSAAEKNSLEKMAKVVNEKPTEAYFELDEEDTVRLLRDGHRAYHTQVNDLLLTALGETLKTLTGEPSHWVTLEGHGREEIAADLDISRTMGWFTSLYPVKLTVEAAAGLGANIKQIKESLRAIPNKGLGYGPIVGYKKSLPSICFNYLGQLDNEAMKEGEQAGNWQIVSESSGRSMHAKNQDQYLINIIASVVSGRFRLDLHCKLNPKFIQSVIIRSELESNNNNIALLLVQIFKRSLLQIIHHAVHQESIEYSPSDFRKVSSEADLTLLPLVPNQNRYDWFEMTEIQKAYLLGRLGHYEIGNISNHIYSEYYFTYLDSEKLENAVNVLISNFEVLRTIYSMERLQQRFLKMDEITRYRIRVNDFACKQNPARLQEIRNRLSHKVYNPEDYPLFTFEISRFEDFQVLHLSIDLILLDVQSRLSLFSMLNDLYRGKLSSVTPPAITFKDYQDYYQLLKYSSWHERDKNYWQHKISSMPLRPTLPFKIQPELVQNPVFEITHYT